MSRKKEYDLGTGQTNAETTDAAAEGGGDHNEALAQRPGDGSDTSASAFQDDQAAIEALQRQSAQSEKLVSRGATTTTTPDSQEGGSTQTSGISDGPGELDQQSAEERLEKVRGWAKGRRTQPAMSADYQELDEILNGEIRRP